MDRPGHQLETGGNKVRRQWIKQTNKKCQNILDYFDICVSIVLFTSCWRQIFEIKIVNLGPDLAAHILMKWPSLKMEISSLYNSVICLCLNGRLNHHTKLFSPRKVHVRMHESFCMKFIFNGQVSSPSTSKNYLSRVR